MISKNCKLNIMIIIDPLKTKLTYTGWPRKKGQWEIHVIAKFYRFQQVNQVSQVFVNENKVERLLYVS